MGKDSLTALRDPALPAWDGYAPQAEQRSEKRGAQAMKEELPQFLSFQGLVVHVEPLPFSISANVWGEKIKTHIFKKTNQQTTSL